jgi:hypothetical protein
VDNAKTMVFDSMKDFVSYIDQGEQNS